MFNDRFYEFLKKSKDEQRFKYPTFYQAVESIVKSAIKICQSVEQHFIFDSYISNSLKGAERSQRCMASIELAYIDADTPLPKQMMKFWGSDDNKILFQNYAAQHILSSKNMNQVIVTSGTIHNKNPISAYMMDRIVSFEVKEIPSLALNIE